MKRFICVILAMIIMTICCSCGGNQLEKSIKEAEKYLEECVVAGCKYGGEYDADECVYRVVVIAPERYSVTDSECAIMNVIGNNIGNNVVPKLTDIFSDVGIPAHIRIYNYDGTIPHIEFKNNSRTHLCYES